MSAQQRNDQGPSPRLPCVVGRSLQHAEPGLTFEDWLAQQGLTVEEWMAQQVPEVPGGDQDLFDAQEAERIRLGLPKPAPLKLPNVRRVYPGVYPEGTEKHEK